MSGRSRSGGARLRAGAIQVAFVLGWTAVIVAGGALVGALVFPLVGLAIDSPRDVTSLAGSGAKQLGFFAFIWAPGIAIVLAFQRAWRSRQSSSSVPPARTLDAPGS